MINDAELGSDNNALSQLRIGTRDSDLALIQALIVQNEFFKKFNYKNVSLISSKTYGDVVQNKPLYSFNGKSLWTKELENLLQDKSSKVDLVVHSLKDLPTELPKGFKLSSILKREDPYDVLVLKKGSKYTSLKDLPPRSVIGTSLLRRSVMIKRFFPYLLISDIRGNIATRLKKLDEENTYDGIILAAAALIRLNQKERISEYLLPPIMYYAVGQGALALETLSSNKKIIDICSLLSDFESTLCCSCERALLKKLNAGCSAPLGVNSSYDHETKTLKLHAIIISIDALIAYENHLVRNVLTVMESEQLGSDLGEILLSMGAKKILDDLITNEQILLNMNSTL